MTPETGMDVSLRVPGKIFLMGEYAVLEGYPAIIAAIQPHHYYRGGVSFSEIQEFIHPESPAGRWWQAFGTVVKSSRGPLGWNAVGAANPKPEDKTGAPESRLGLGSSTADLCAAWLTHRVPSQPDGLLKWYREQFPKQSGADLMVQLESISEGLGVYHANPTEGRMRTQKLGKATQRVWFYRVPSHQKLATHIHLKGYSPVRFDSYKVEFWLGSMERLLACEEMTRDYRVLTDWASELAELGLETELARNIREEALRVRGVVGAKGCGAGLHDVVMLAVHERFDAPALEKWVERHQLQPIGSLWDLTQESDSVSAFAPVNIAWIKYMGKDEGGPVNSSCSLTLDRLGTLTRISTVHAEHTDAQPISPFTESDRLLKLSWSPLGYVPNELGKNKVETFLSDDELWRTLIQDLGYSYHPLEGRFLILTENSVPAGTGIATSASSFAALTLSWSLMHLSPSDRIRWIQQFESPEPPGVKMRQRLAQTARRGSGSAGRSIEGPWVLWTPRSDIEFQKMDWDADWIDCVLLLETEHKKVSSSQAHVRVKTSPLFLERSNRAEQRLKQLTALLQSPKLTRDRIALQSLALEEALEMHELFHTSQPSFSYLLDSTRQWLEWAQKARDLPSQDFVVTLDAGANLHWIVRPDEIKLWRSWFHFKDPKLLWIEGRAGSGSVYWRDEQG